MTTVCNSVNSHQIIHKTPYISPMVTRYVVSHVNSEVWSIILIRGYIFGMCSYIETLLYSGWLLPWASCPIRKITGCACAGNAGNVFPRHRFQRKSLVSDPGMYHGTCVTHAPCCMSGSLTRDDGENDPGIPGACATRNFTRPNLVIHTFYSV